MAEPSPPAAPAAPLTPSLGGDNFSEIFDAGLSAAPPAEAPPAAPPAEPATPVAPAEPPAATPLAAGGIPAAAPPAGTGIAEFLPTDPAGAPPAGAPAWDADAFVEQYMPSSIREKLDTKAGEAFGEIREKFKTLAMENQRLTTSAADEAARVATAAQEEARELYKDYDLLKAQNALWNDDTFANEHQEQAASILAEQKAILVKSGMDPALADQAAGISDAYEAGKFWHDLTATADPFLQRMLVDKGADMARTLTGMRDKMRSPMGLVDDYKTKTAAAQQQQQQERSALTGARAIEIHRAAVAEAAKTNPVFQTAGGLQLAQQIEQQYATNAPLDEGVLARERVAAASVPALTQYIKRLEERVGIAEKNANDLSAMEPPSGGTDAAPAGESGGSGLFEGMIGDGGVGKYSKGLFPTK